MGVDLAAEPANTAVARIGWTDSSAEVQAVGVGVDDPMLVEEITVRHQLVDTPADPQGERRAADEGVSGR